MSATALLAAIGGCSSSSKSEPAPVEAGSSGSSGTSGTSGTPPPPPGNPPPPAPPPTDGGKDAAKEGGDGGDGGACLDDTGAAVVCPGPGGAGCATACTTIMTNYKKGVARDAVANLTAANCTNNTEDVVVFASAGKACTDATAAAFCASFAGCAGDAVFTANCTKIVNGLNGTGASCAGGVAPTLGRAALCDCVNNNGNVPTCGDCLKFVSGKTYP